MLISVYRYVSWSIVCSWHTLWGGEYIFTKGMNEYIAIM